ncbi:MAG: hypothetical protein ACXVCY_00355 [Pseudobdellovibrionaceae bacterium]
MNINIRQNENSGFYQALERLRVISDLKSENWQDLLEVNWAEYSMIRSGIKDLSEKSFSNITNYFKLDPNSFALGELDFHKFQINLESQWELPTPYSYATYGRSRTTINAFDYLEKFHGWQLRYEVLKHLNLSESVLVNPFDPISMKVITDSFAYLATRQFSKKDFYSMGLYTHFSNLDSILGKHYSQLKSASEIVEHMIGECLPFYEQNCTYRFIKFNKNQAIVEVKENSFVTDEMQVRHLGNPHVCWLKSGWLASTPIYLGQPPLSVIKKSCVHNGDSSCRYEVNFSKHPTQQTSIMPLSLQPHERYGYFLNESYRSRPSTTSP